MGPVSDGKAPRVLAALACCLAMLLSPGSPASAQDSGKGDLGAIVGDLLGASPDGAAPTLAGRRLPFGREQMQLSFAPLVKETAPAVVNVYASSRVRVQSPFMGDPFFERFFGGQMPERLQSSLGSGVLVDPAGFVVTNNHVIRGADQVKVALSDGREFESRILLKDESVDLAVLKIEAPEAFPVVALGDSDALEVGDLVLAIGNPFGVGQTTTSGIVSALARNHIGISDFGFFIQTDAAINPGNSGGPLINMRGELIGINTAIYSRSGGSVGIGFAIPSNMVRAFLHSAKSGSDFFERPYIGAAFQEVTPAMAEALGMARPTGALVASVAAEGPAAQAGLKPGDVVTAMNGTPIDGPDSLGYRLSTQEIGSQASFEVLRQGASEKLSIDLVRAPEGDSAREVAIDGQSPFAGAKVATLSPRLAQRLGLPTEATGVCVVDIADNSPAQGFGLQPRDIVREVNGTSIRTVGDLQKVAGENTRWWRFTIDRGGQTIRQQLRY